jgi:hypothetical protein
VIVKARSSGTVGGVIIVDDVGGTETNQTTAARDRATTDDIILVADDALIDDYLYIGAIDKFDRINFDVGVAGTGSYILGWSYWDGSDWLSPLTGISDTTELFKLAGNGRIEFDIPGDWATTDVAFDTPSAGSIDSMYWIRGSVIIGTMTIQPLGNTISVAGGNTVKYLPFESTGTIESGTGLAVTAVWLPDLIAS